MRDIRSRPRTSPGRTAVVVAVVLVGIALLRLVGTVVFTFFTAPEDGGVATGADRAFAAWSGGMAAALLVAAVLLLRGSPRARTAAVALLLVDVAFSIAKFVSYDEPESLVFGAVDLFLLAALVPGRRGARPPAHDRA